MIPREKLKMDDCTIIGGGVIGLSLAYELTNHRLRVRLIDRGPIGKEASWAGAGILPPANLETAVHPLDQLRAISHQRHLSLAKALQHETGIDTGFRSCGGIYLARSAGEAASLVGLEDYFREQKILIKKITPEKLVDLEPALLPLVESGQCKAAYVLPGECQLRNPEHLRALEKACQSRSVEIIPHAEVTDFESHGGRLQSVVTNVGKFSAQRFCITGGAWTYGLLAKLGITTGIMPIRGQMVLYRSDERLFSRVLNDGPRYMVPRDDGRVLVGSTEEEAGFDKSTTDQGIAELKQLAEEIVPDLKQAEVERTWAGLRPGSFDGFPYMGAVPGLENAFVAAGHFRSGLHMSPGVALVMGRLIRGEDPRLDLSPFAVGRG